MSRALFLAVVLVGCASTSPQPTTATHSRIDAHAPSTASDGETLGADETTPADRLQSGAGASFRPGESNPFALELAPGWVMGPNGPEPASQHRATPEVKSQSATVPNRLRR